MFHPHREASHAEAFTLLIPPSRQQSLHCHGGSRLWGGQWVLSPPSNTFRYWGLLLEEEKGQDGAVQTRIC